MPRRQPKYATGTVLFPLGISKDNTEGLDTIMDSDGEDEGEVQDATAPIRIQLTSFDAEFIQRVCMNQLRDIERKNRINIHWGNDSSDHDIIVLSGRVGPEVLETAKESVIALYANLTRFTPPLHCPKADQSAVYKITNKCRILEKQYKMAILVDELADLLRLNVIADHELKYEAVRRMVESSRSQEVTFKLVLPKEEFARFQQLKVEDPSLGPTLKSKYNILGIKAIKKRFHIRATQTSHIEAVVREIRFLIANGSLMTAEQAEQAKQEEIKAKELAVAERKAAREADLARAHAIEEAKEKATASAAPVAVQAAQSPAPPPQPNETVQVEESAPEVKAKDVNVGEVAPNILQRALSVRHDLDQGLQTLLRDMEIADDADGKEVVLEEDDDNDLPSHWDHMPAGLNAMAFLLDPASDEYASVVEAIDFKTNVSSVERIQNKTLWRLFSEKCGSDPRELRWVGTGGLSPEEIFETTVGFDVAVDRLALSSKRSHSPASRSRKGAASRGSLTMGSSSSHEESSHRKSCKSSGFEFWKKAATSNVQAHYRHNKGRQLILADVTSSNLNRMVLRRLKAAYPSYVVTYRNN